VWEHLSFTQLKNKVKNNKLFSHQIISNADHLQKQQSDVFSMFTRYRCSPSCLCEENISPGTRPSSYPSPSFHEATVWSKYYHMNYTRSSDHGNRKLLFTSDSWIVCRRKTWWDMRHTTMWLCKLKHKTIMGVVDFEVFANGVLGQALMNKLVCPDTGKQHHHTHTHTHT